MKTTRNTAKIPKLVAAKLQKQAEEMKKACRRHLTEEEALGKYRNGEKSCRKKAAKAG